MHMLTKADKLLVGILLILAAGGIWANLALVSSAGDQVAEVYKAGVLVQTIPLKPGYRQELRLGGAEQFNLIQAEDGKIRVEEADCPDQVCVRTGWVSFAPQQIVCLPYRVVIKVVSAKQTDIDDIAK